MLKLWDKKTNIITPNGTEYTPEQLMTKPEFGFTRHVETVLELHGPIAVAIDNMHTLLQVYGLDERLTGQDALEAIKQAKEEREKAWQGPEEPVLTFDEIKAKAIGETREILAKTLEAPIRFNDKHYSVTLEKQNLLSAQLGLYGLNTQAGIETKLTWNATGEPCEPWTFEALLTLSNTIAAHVKPLAQLQREAEVSIGKAENEKEVRDVITEYAAALEKM